MCGMLRPENGQDREKQRIRATGSGSKKKMGGMRKVAAEAIREKKT